MKIIISAGPVTAEADLAETPTAKAVYEALPIEAQALTWGDEIYFEIPVHRKLETTAVELVQAGDLGYWPTGRAFCIFFGPTPVSGPGEIRPASAVNLIGRLRGQPEAFKAVTAGTKIHLQRSG